MFARTVALAGALAVLLCLPLVCEAQNAELKIPSFEHLKHQATDSVDISLGAWPLRVAAFFMDKDDPEAVKEVFAEMLALFERGKLKPLPTHTFPAAQMQDAFKTMAQAGHIGKVVVDLEADDLQVDLSTAIPLALSKDGGYLITVVQLPPAASLARTDAVNRRIVDFLSARRP